MAAHDQPYVATSQRHAQVINLKTRIIGLLLGAFIGAFMGTGTGIVIGGGEGMRGIWVFCMLIVTEN